MLMRQCGCLGVVISAFGFFLQVSTGEALAQDRRQECAAKYKVAKAEGALGGLTWPQFFSRCVAELKAAPEVPAETTPAAAVPEPINPLKPTAVEPVRPAEIEPASPPPAAAEAPAPAAPPVEAVTAAPPPVPVVPPEPAPAAAPVAPVAVPSAKEASPAPGQPVFPTAIAPAYAKDKPAAARKKTCQDQYNANKATDSNGGLKWTQKGGGYLPKCLEHLKGES
jgi:hypothetical protein